MHKALAIIAVAGGLAACGMISTLVDGFKMASAVESDLEVATGLKPQVGFNWSNGRLLTVTVTFPQLYDAKPLRDVADTVRAAVAKEFRQRPENIVLGFSTGRGEQVRTAQSVQTN